MLFIYGGLWEYKSLGRGNKILHMFFGRAPRMQSPFYIEVVSPDKYEVLNYIIHFSIHGQKLIYTKCYSEVQRFINIKIKIHQSIDPPWINP